MSSKTKPSTRVSEPSFKYRIDIEPGAPAPLLVIDGPKQGWFDEGDDTDDFKSWSEEPSDLWKNMSRPSCALEVTLLFAEWWDVNA